MLILLNLGTLNALALYIFTNRSSQFPYKVYTVECILVWLPLIYIFCYAVWNRTHKRKWYNSVKQELLRLLNPARLLRERGTDGERKQLVNNPQNPNIFSGRSLEDSVNFTSDDPDEGLFRRATRRNRYNRCVQSGAPVSTTVVSVSGVSDDLVKRDSGTSTGGSSISGLHSNDS